MVRHYLFTSVSKLRYIHKNRTSHIDFWPSNVAGQVSSKTRLTGQFFIVQSEYEDMTKKFWDTTKQWLTACQKSLW